MLRQNLHLLMVFKFLFSLNQNVKVLAWLESLDHPSSCRKGARLQQGRQKGLDPRNSLCLSTSMRHLQIVCMSFYCFHININPYYSYDLYLGALCVTLDPRDLKGGLRRKVGRKVQRPPHGGWLRCIKAVLRCKRLQAPRAPNPLPAANARNTVPPKSQKSDTSRYFLCKIELSQARSWA